MTSRPLQALVPSLGVGVLRVTTPGQVELLVTFTARPGRRWGQARLLRAELPLPARDSHSRPEECTLDTALLELNAAPMDWRAQVAVLKSDLPALTHALTQDGSPVILPLTEVTAPRVGRGARNSSIAIWLDQVQFLATCCAASRGAVLPRAAAWHDAQTECRAAYAAARYDVKGEAVVPRADGDGTLAQVGATDLVERHGQPTVVLGSDLYASLGRPTHVGLAQCLGDVPERSVQRWVIGRVATVGQGVKAADGGCVLVDQVLRNALGVELQEHVWVRPLSPQRTRLTDLVLGRPRWTTLRVQRADLTTAEQPVVLLPDLVMSVLGVAEGDEVYVEAVGRSGDGEVSSARLSLRAHATPALIEEERRLQHGGGEHTRFPSAEQVLGVYPDLPWAFLDADARAILGLRGPLGVVRVRTSRRHQVLREFRDLALILVVAGIGVLKFGGTGGAVALLGVLVAASVLVVVRLRSRLHVRGAWAPRAAHRFWQRSSR